MNKLLVVVLGILGGIGCCITLYGVYGFWFGEICGIAKQIGFVCFNVNSSAKGVYFYSGGYVLFGLAILYRVKSDWGDSGFSKSSGYNEQKIRSLDRQISLDGLEVLASSGLKYDQKEHLLRIKLGGCLVLLVAPFVIAIMLFVVFLGLFISNEHISYKILLFGIDAMIAVPFFMAFWRWTLVVDPVAKNIGWSPFLMSHISYANMGTLLSFDISKLIHPHRHAGTSWYINAIFENGDKRVIIAKGEDRARKIAGALNAFISGHAESKN